jgi:hypothetical protein
LVVIFIAVLVPKASAQSTAPLTEVDGCGTGWNTWLVPDSLPLLQCNFQSACNKHDQCYGKCEGRALDPKAPHCEYLRCRKGGDLAGSQTCNTNVRLVRVNLAAMERRQKCDVAFEVDIRTDNVRKPVCHAFARVYRLAVKYWGEGAFIGIDPLGRTLGQPMDQYMGAIREFFEKGTPQQFEEWAKTTGEPAVDFNAPIRFDPARGLVNIQK